MLKLIFGPKRDEVTGEWRKLDNEELNDLYCSPNIILMIKLGRMRWAGDLARMGRRKVSIQHFISTRVQNELQKVLFYRTGKLIRRAIQILKE